MKESTKANKILLVNELVVGISILLFSLFTIGVEAQPDNKMTDIPVEEAQPDNKVIDIPVEDAPRYLASDPVNKRMYVTNFLNPTVTVIDTTKNTVIGNPIPVTDGSSRIEYDPVNKRMYVANFSGKTVSVINVR